MGCESSNSVPAITFGQVSDLMELVRTKAVAAMKSGKLLALRLGTAQQRTSRLALVCKTSSTHILYPGEKIPRWTRTTEYDT